MKNLIKDILKGFSDKKLEKDYYTKYIFDMESNINKILKSNNYDLLQDDMERINILRIDSENRIQILKENSLKEYNINISFWENKYSEFLKFYHIGYLKKFILNKDGMFEVGISGLITNHSSKTTEKEKFKNSLDLLNSMGYKLIQKYNSYYISLESLHLVKKILEDIGGKLIYITTRNNLIDSYSFIIRPSEISLILNKITKEKDEIKLVDNNKLNIEEIETLKDLLKNLYHLEDVDIESSGYLYYSYFSEICQIFNLETKISKDFKNFHAKNRKLNLEIKDLENKTSKDTNLSNLSENIKNINSKFEFFTISELSFFGQLTMDKYSFFHFELRYNISDYHFDLDNDENIIINEDKLKTTFETCGLSKKQENLYIKDTIENRTMIEEKLTKKYPTINVNNIESQKDRFGNWFIYKIEGTIYNLKDLI